MCGGPRCWITIRFTVEAFSIVVILVEALPFWQGKYSRFSYPSRGSLRLFLTASCRKVSNMIWTNGPKPTVPGECW
ncbi:hypothetical protein B0I35DRAFT_33669 [Stachybotrys elegans]|uniref:Uncharacterized protein n=1 Tax=Stachybotrys elegans TaxID=80388 RepID=A0A8K0T458_9HYPO|nr:hypothetical protein B0I35DRAFT_33669 [Stachybotrys elegans]